MSSRRTFLKTAGAVTAGIAGASTASASTDKNAMVRKYSGPHEMPTNVTLLSMQNADGSETLGVKLDNDAVLDVRKASHLLGIAAPVTLEELLKEGNARGLNKLVAAAKTSPKAKAAMVKESSITFGRLFTNPGKIVCIGLNYRAHVQETNEKLPGVPILFNKYNNALAAHNCTIKLPPREVSYKFDYETELLIVIGKKARNVSEADALNYVAGYCTSHDFSARDLQLESIIQHQSHDFNPQKLIAYISKMWTLEPGDIIWSGTPQGVILGYPKDKQVWLKAGDEIVSTIEKLGSLKFKLA